MDTRHDDRPEDSDKPRRPYQRPVIAWEEDFLPYAYSTCGKMAGQGGACNLHRLS
jgi:hypothetical protein